MIVSILQSLTSLLLAGVLCYTVFTLEWAKGKKQTQQVLLGLVLGALVIVLGINSFVLEPLRAPFDAKSGPLIFAGYLGGPIGAVIAGICGSLYQLSMGGSSTSLGVFMTIAIPAIGLAVSYLHPPRDWPITRVSGISRILVCYVLLHIVPFVYFSMNETGRDPVSTAMATTIGFMIVGSLSILVTWQIVNYAFRVADSANRNGALVKQLNLAMRASGMGMFVHDVSKPEIHLDAGMMAIYGLERPSGMISLAEFQTFVHPDDRTRVESEVQKARKGGNMVNGVDRRAVRSDGAVRHIRAHWIIERDAEGAALRATGVHTDLTDILETERKHRDTDSRLAMIAEKLPGVIFENDATDRGKPKLQYIARNALTSGATPSTNFMLNPNCS